MPDLPSDLYARILGDAWWRLPEVVRLMHGVGGEVRGRFGITHGKRWLAKRLASWSRLPHQAESSQTVLKISVEGAGERWDRNFDGVVFSTSQWTTGDRCLVERFKGWELVFALSVDGLTLVYEQRRARFCVGPLRLRVPRLFAPRIRAMETGVEQNRVHVEVKVSLPLIGLLIAYDGHLEAEVPNP